MAVKTKSIFEQAKEAVHCITHPTGTVFIVRKRDENLKMKRGK
jgi:hypothetical protein